MVSVCVLHQKRSQPLTSGGGGGGGLVVQSWIRANPGLT